MTKQDKEKVYERYEEIVEWIDRIRNKNLMEAEYLNLILKKVSGGGTV